MSSSLNPVDVIITTNTHIVENAPQNVLVNISIIGIENAVRNQTVHKAMFGSAINAKKNLSLFMIFK